MAVYPNPPVIPVGGASSWCYTHGAPIKEDVWLRTGHIIDADGHSYDPRTGRELISLRGFHPTQGFRQ